MLQRNGAEINTTQTFRILKTTLAEFSAAKDRTQNLGVSSDAKRARMKILAVWFCRFGQIAAQVDMFAL